MKNLGVIIGRFQIDRLHDGYKFLIDSVMSTHPDVLIMVGYRDTPPTDTNPLPVNIRIDMVRTAYPSATVVGIRDHQSNGEWSKTVDATIRRFDYTNGGAVLYGSRDSFIRAYSGEYKTQVVESHIIASASERRARIKTEPYRGQKFRAGIIYSMQHLIPRTYEAVDAAMLRATNTGVNVLLARKQGTNQWRFPGGHVNGNELTVDAAHREMREETGLTFTSPLQMLGEFLVDDWRVRDTTKAFYRTFLYVGWSSWGDAVASDDIEEVCWFPVCMSPESEDLVAEHRPLFKVLQEHCKTLPPRAL